MKERIIEKMNAHINMLLEKRELTNDDYRILHEVLSDIEMREKNEKLEAEAAERNERWIRVMSEAVGVTIPKGVGV